jgi:glycosyltransferase involved in cell wall biosynthesis
MRRELGIQDVVAVLKLARLLQKLQPAIVETHTHKAGTLGRLATVLAFGLGPRRPSLIHTFHGHVFKGHFAGPAIHTFVAIERALARLNNVVISVSSKIREELVEEYRIAPAEKIRVVPPGLDFSWIAELERRRGWLRARLGVNDSTLIFGVVGRLAKIKNIVLILHAFARMIRANPIDARLVLIGDGETRPELELLIRRLGLEQKVAFCGWVLEHADIFSDLDVTCLSSFNEGLPVSLVESLAAGVPVIATDVGGVSDVVEAATDGELVKSGDIEGFAEALARLASQRRRLAPERSTAIQEKYSTRRMATSMEAIYEELLQQRGFTLRPASATYRDQLAEFRVNQPVLVSQKARQLELTVNPGISPSTAGDRP